MFKNHLKSWLGAVLEALGGGLGAILVPRAPQDRKREKKGLHGPPPQGAKLDSFSGSFSLLGAPGPKKTRFLRGLFSDPFSVSFLGGAKPEK